MESAYLVGTSYLVRTTTFFIVGRLKKSTILELVFEDASWVADTGRFHDCLKNGTFNEVEPFINDVIVPRANVCDATIWTHPLPREQK